ncbi:endocuticle structural glycoprotein ABD-4 [Tribolium castaneum]|uniref:Larval cuticle protein 8-like Protein n=1 Tax=Tribolium castaneum TaxID=7070 RepID=D6WNK5_TRICA|nr:PREDICTED: endocuticle structural glycoprotein ABD-4 [Tribolium castaneum]EFA03216.1 Larval cuticle protein 8-like Protein [Tribolium castaneum]|eukprot:XP_973761.1 PREDICTED: endocuticle structural glycoprotein ABD-4 [Tribolium castaneum]
MIKLVLVVCFAAAALAAAIEKEVIPIVSQESEVDYSGKFHYSYESGDGTKAQEIGELKSFDKDNAGEVVSGDFQYTGDDGKTYKVAYTADENGYHPQGEHIPQVPPLIARALDYLATAPPPKDGKY